MCGIVGGAQAGVGLDSGLLEGMRDLLVHRGPDDAGAWRAPECGVALGHRRLSIIDLSAGARQPMEDPSGRLQLVFNGEIYNFRALRDELAAGGQSFRTSSDTEVVLAAYRRWGTACVRRLEGMFALALYDREAGTLFLARDRAGEKPLFYHHAGGRLLFASELKALMSVPGFPREADPEAVDCYFAYGFVPRGLSILRGVRKLPPGHAATYHVDGDALRTWAYWTLPEPFGGPEPDEGALVAELESLLTDSVARQLVADVPVAVLLSGGLDSSLVTAAAARASSSPVKTFNVAFPGHGRLDESAYARTVARHFGTDHTELPLELATPELLPQLARQYDEPLADPSIVPTYLVCRLVRGHATVALGGDGGDELFGGYQHYGLIQRQEQLRRLVPGPLRRGVATAGRALPMGTRGRNHLMALGGDVRTSVAHVNLYFDAATRRRLLAPLYARTGVPPAAELVKTGLCAHGRTPLQQATAVDFLTYLPDDILVKVDRASMLSSLEVRAPFLDPRILEFAFGRVPDRLRATGSRRKVLLRRLAARMLPAELDVTRKQGFSIPLASWFRGEWGGMLNDVLSGADPRVFDPAVVQGLLAGQRRGLSNGNRLFMLTMFELWRREYGVSLAS